MSRTHSIGARCGGQISDSRWPVRLAALIRESKAKEEKKRNEEEVDGWPFYVPCGSCDWYFRLWAVTID